VNVEKPFSGGQVHFLLFLPNFKMGISLLIIVFTPHLKLHLNPEQNKIRRSSKSD
jgi:hypothetical protein